MRKKLKTYLVKTKVETIKVKAEDMHYSASDDAVYFVTKDVQVAMVKFPLSAVDCASIAQLEELRICNPGVTGSSPVAGSNKTDTSMLKKGHSHR